MRPPWQESVGEQAARGDAQLRVRARRQGAEQLTEPGLVRVVVDEDEEKHGQLIAEAPEVLLAVDQPERALLVEDSEHLLLERRQAAWRGAVAVHVIYMSVKTGSPFERAVTYLHLA